MGSFVKLKMRQSLYEVKTIVARYPRLALPVARRRHGVPVGPGIELVIEGFPRTGTSFATVAFSMAQDRPVPVAGHVHAPAQVIAATRGHIPALVLVRDPEETILSFVLRHPHIGMRQALRGYLRFYAPLVPYMPGFVTGLFQEVTADYGAVIRRVNQRFGTSFREFEHTKENVDAAFGSLAGDYRGWVGSGHTFDRIVPIPSAGRTEMKEALRARYRSGDLEGLRRRVEESYAAFLREHDATRR